MQAVSLFLPQALGVAVGKLMPRFPPHLPSMDDGSIFLLVLLGT